jgi:TonB family protein
MAPLVKETAEATNAAAESAAQAGIQAKPPTDHLSSDAVSLEVPINIHGSRVTEVVRGVTPHTEPFEEQTTTMIVFPQGGVLRMATPVTAGQMLVLTNLKSRQDAICRVVKVRTYSSAASYVEVEFTHAQAGYWGVYFSSDGPELAKKGARPASLDTPGLEGAEKNAGNAPGARDHAALSPSSQVQAKEPNAPSTLGIPANRTQSSFISIGSQEEVQPSATSTTFKRGSRITPDKQQPLNTPKTDQVTVAPVAPQQARSTAESGETQAVSDQTSFNEGATANREKSAAASGSFGEVFGSSSSRATREGASSGVESSLTPAANTGATQNWKLIAGGVTLGIILAGSAFLLFRPSGSGNGAAKTGRTVAVQPDLAQPAQATTAQPAAAHAASGSSGQTSQATPKSSLAAEAKRATEAAVVATAKTPKPSETPDADATRSSTAERRNVPDVTSNLFGSLNAHPIAGHSDEKREADSAPSVDASVPSPSNGNSALPVIPAPSSVLMPVPTQSGPGMALQVGGQVPEPKLLVSSLPVYPAAAKQTRTEGSVVLRALIDQNGQVADEQVVSGPTLLRQAAVDAVKHWKYEPSRVNGKAVPVQTLVTIHFRL